MSHLRDNAMTYWQHWRFAAGHAWRCLVAAVLLFVHAWVPWMFADTGRRLVSRMGRDFGNLSRDPNGHVR
jgi:hypothetical protein